MTERRERTPIATRALVTGGAGMLGRATTAHWRAQGAACLGLDRARADITDRAALVAWAEAFRPQVIVNCAAFTRVDDCETERETAMRVNGEAVANLVAAAESCNAALLHVSSDYVFPGDAGPGDATPGDLHGVDSDPAASADSDEIGPSGGILEDAPTGPRSVYGESKLLGEQEALRYDRALVVRASWLFGPGGPNFVATIRRLLESGKPLRVVDDQRGRPTYTPFLARALYDLAGLVADTSRRDDLPRVVHYGNRDPATWFDFARAIAEHLAPGLDAPPEVAPCTTDEFPRPAPRPANSVLSVERFEHLVGRRVEPWLVGLTEYLEIS